MSDPTGILCIDKPSGFTSFDVVAKLRGIVGTRKVGHAGTLDPMATGVLPLFFGRATKACDILPRQDKCYEAEFRLGITTDTQDITGNQLSEQPFPTDEQLVQAAASQFVGDILQLPPMFSAIKVKGRKLYDLARQGIEVERQPRPITIHSIRFLSQNPLAGVYRIEVHCSKGAYIRTLAADIGQALGCGATLTALRRTMAAGFTLRDCITIEQARELAAAGVLGERMLPIGQAFACLPKANLSGAQARMFCNGVRLDPARISRETGNGEAYAVYGGETFLGTAAILDGAFCMTKLFTLGV